MFLDFADFSSYLQIKETVLKRGGTIFSEPEMISSSLIQFWKTLIKIRKLQS